MRALPVALLLTAIAIPVAAQTPQPSVIVTQGEAILKRAPDRAWLGVSVETRDVRPAEARRKNAESMTEVQGALKAAGVAPDAVRTTGFSLSPEFDWNNGRSTLRGYVVRNQIEVRVDDLDKLPAVLDAANVAKGIALSISGPRFDLRDPDTPETEALRLAVEAALRRAGALAAGAKRTVGRVIRVEEHNAGAVPPPMPMMMRVGGAADSAAQTPVTPGEIEVRAHVTVTVELQ